MRWAEACLVNFLLRPCSASWDVSAESPTLQGLSFANHSSLRRCRGALPPAGPRHLKPGLSRSGCSLTDGFLRVVQKGRPLERRCKVVPQALRDCKARRQDKKRPWFSPWLISHGLHCCNSCAFPASDSGAGEPYAVNSWLSGHQSSVRGTVTYNYCFSTTVSAAPYGQEA